MIGKCPHISSKILDFVATVTSLKVSMSGQKFLVLLPLTGLERSWCVVKKYPILLPWINCKLLTFSNQQRLMNVTQAQISTGVNSMFYTLRPWKQLPAIKKSYFYVLHIQRETFLNYSQSLLPDWWINIPPASSYWQAPSLITKHTHNSVSICCADNNGSGLLNSPHSASFLPLFTLKFSSSASMSLSVFFFFFSSSLDFKPWSFRRVEATERINVQRTRDQTLSRVWDSAHRSIWSNASRKIYIKKYEE